jgi:hypothetical protein
VKAKTKRKAVFCVSALLIVAVLLLLALQPETDHPRWSLGFNRGVPWKFNVSSVYFVNPGPSSCSQVTHYHLGPITVIHWDYHKPFNAASELNGPKPPKQQTDTPNSP